MAKINECIYERGDSLQVKIPYYDENGKRTSTSKTFSIKKYGTKQKALLAAKKFRDETKVKLSNDMLVKEKRASLEEVFKKALDLDQNSYNTRRKEESIFYHHFAPAVDIKRDIKSIKFDDIQNQLNSMTENCSQNMIKRAFSIWKKCFRYAIADDYILKDETYKVRVPKSELISKKKEQSTSYSQVVEVLDQIDTRVKNSRNKMLYKNAIWIMLYTGMRPSEVFALEVDAIDFEDRVIHVYQRIGSTSKNRYAVVKPKTDSSVRDIMYRSDLDEALHELCDNSVDGYLFMKKDGKLVNGDEFSSMLHRVSDGSFRAYTLRHQYSTDMLQDNKVDIRTIMELMGHTESTMTLYYARSNDQKKREAVENRVINGAKQA